MGVTCYKPATESVIDSFRTLVTPNRTAVLARNLSSGIRILGLNYESNRLLCSYRRILNGSGSFMADLNTDKFAIWAYGSGSSGPNEHTPAERGASAEAINLQFKVILITTS